jgi:hypothetical protein
VRLSGSDMGFTHGVDGVLLSGDAARPRGGSITVSDETETHMDLAGRELLYREHGI